MDSLLPHIYYINGSFLVFDKDHAIALRSQRIVGQLIGATSAGSSQQIVSSSLPYHLSQYAASLAFELRLATFTRLIKNEDSLIASNVPNYLDNLSKLQEDARKGHFARRQMELCKRNIEANEERLGSFDEAKVRLPVEAVPVVSRSSYRSETITESELKSIFELVDDSKHIVYRDLHQRGFFVTSGSKFGCDFLAYLGDPVLYHAKFALRIMPELNGSVDVSKVEINELNALHRLCHNASKILLFAVVSRDPAGRNSLNYWSIKTKEYLSLESKSALVEYPIDCFYSHDSVSSYHNHSQTV